MSFAVYRVDVDPKGARGPHHLEGSRLFHQRYDALEFAEGIARSYRLFGLNDEQGYWWCRDEKGGKVLLIVSARESDARGVEPGN